MKCAAFCPFFFAKKSWNHDFVWANCTENRALKRRRRRRRRRRRESREKGSFYNCFVQLKIWKTRALSTLSWTRLILHGEWIADARNLCQQFQGCHTSHKTNIKFCTKQHSPHTTSCTFNTPFDFLRERFSCMAPLSRLITHIQLSQSSSRKNWDFTT